MREIEKDFIRKRAIRNLQIAIDKWLPFKNFNLRLLCSQKY